MNAPSSLVPSTSPTSKRQAALSDEGIKEHLDSWFATHGQALIQFRRYLHAHPELSGCEQGTAALIAERLAAAGLQPTLLPAGNGVICDVGAGERTIGLRADLDALPLPDLKDVPYRSTIDGVCHACGHDAHTTVLLGTMLALAEIADLLPVRVRALFQPSEESAPFGAMDVIDAGGLAEVDEIYALHCYPQLPAGQVGLRVGGLTAACDLATVRLTGPGGHTARPHLTVDLVGALARLINEVPALLARQFDNRGGLLVVFGTLHTGAANNVIPQEGTAGCTIRVLDTEIWRQIPKAFDEIVRHITAPSGAKVEIDYQRGVPPVMNDERLVSIFATAAGVALGPGSVHPAPHSMGGEDFAWYLEHVPGAMVRLGVGRSDITVDLHQGDFDIDERALEYGVRLMTQTVIETGRR
ncbi:MAG: amidohydrolase [Corynebacteriales bacterium]|nr:amidohydrolase [Mycobacteriales bacterium]